MPDIHKSVPEARNSSIVAASRLVILAICCALLYWGRAVFEPIALAVLLNFVLSPIVRKLQKWKIPRLVAVGVVAIGAMVAISTLLWGVGVQLSDLAERIPEKREIIKEKIADIRGMSDGGSIEQIQDTIKSVSDEIEEEEKAKEVAKEGTEESSKGGVPPMLTPTPPNSVELYKIKPTPGEAPVAVTIVPKSQIINWNSLASLTPVFTSLGQVALVFILVILLLIAEDDVRSRIAALAGEARLAVTTKALHDAGRRISGYLGVQLILNGVYGLAVGIGLFFIGVPYAILWGVCAALFRYVPYVGPWVAALLPLATAFILSPGLQIVGAVVALFIVLELLSNNVMEPWLYGKTVGIPAFVLIISAVFWTWLWGPIGLVLSTPLTVCLVAVGEHIPALNFLARLLGSEQQISSELLLYQRLLAHDATAVSEFIDQEIAKADTEGMDTPVDAVSRDIIAPVLQLLKRDVALGTLMEQDQEYVLGVLQDKIKHLSEVHANPGKGVASKHISLCAASDSVDETAAQLLALVLEAGGASCSILSSALLASEISEAVKASGARLACIVSVPPVAFAQSVRLCKRLHQRESDIEIAVNHWGEITPAKRETLIAAGADHVAEGLWGGHDLLAPRDQFYRSQAGT